MEKETLNRNHSVLGIEEFEIGEYRMIPLRDIGLDIAVLGSIISCIGVIWNNIFLDHVAAMQIWALSNILLMIWAYGMWKHWWEDGLSGLVLCLMYAFYTVTNVYGLVMSGVI